MVQKSPAYDCLACAAGLHVHETNQKIQQVKENVLNAKQNNASPPLHC